MTRHAGLVSFTATVAFVVPVAWHALDADFRSDGRRVRPLQKTLELDGARVTLDVDRALIVTGDTVVATLHAYADTPKQVTVDVTAFDSSNYEGSRVESPQVAIDHEKIVLAADPGGTRAVTTRIRLGKLPGGAGLVDNFRIYVTPHGVKPRTSYSDDGDEPAAAVAYVLGWSGNSLAVAIEPEGALRAGERAVVAVRTKNTTRRTQCRPWVELGNNVGESTLASEGIEVESIDRHDEEEKCAWKPGAVDVQRFSVRVTSPMQKVALVAQAFSLPDNNPGPVTGGGMAVREVAVADAGATVAEK